MGDYIFTDEAFVKQLSTGNRNVFQKVYDEIKYLCKVATAGSKEAREIEKAKRIFDKVYKENVYKQQLAKESEGGPQYSLSDTSGRQITGEQAEFFKDSVVKDENGSLKVMYHGTSSGGYTVFDTYGSRYGLFGTGSYFTDSKTIGESYTKKGKGQNPRVYEVYLNIKNPIDMDAQADAAAWRKAMPEADFPASGTNEQFYRAMEEYFEDNEYTRWEAAEVAIDILQGMGYDGITHIGGGRVNADGERHQVYIAFEPEQIKNVDNAQPTADPDIRYSLTDSDGKRDGTHIYIHNGEYIPQEKLQKGIANYEQKEYNQYGWVRANDIVSSGYWRDFTSKLAGATTKQQTFYKTPDGEYIIPANDLSADGIENVLFYAKGSIEEPIVSKVVKINLDNETEIDVVRSEIYESKGNFDETLAEGIFEVYDAKSFPWMPAKQSKDNGSISGNRRNKLGRGVSEQIRTNEGGPSVSKGRLSISEALHEAPKLYGDDVRGTELLYNEPMQEATVSNSETVADDFLPDDYAPIDDFEPAAEELDEGLYEPIAEDLPPDDYAPIENSYIVEKELDR